MTATDPAAGPAGRTLPAEVADARRALGALTAAHVPGDEGAEVRDVPRPVVALAGAPGRGRHALAAALLGIGGAGTTDLAGTPPRWWVHTARPGTPPAGARAVTVPLLEELDLHVPSRGHGGRVAGGAASAVVVLADAAAPLDRAELAALTELAGAVETVVPVLVRVEAHRGWRTVLDADRALVAEAVPRLAGVGWFPVSVELARRAAADPPAVPTATAQALRRGSGVAPLQRALHRLVARRARMLAETNALRRATTAAGRLAEIPAPRGRPADGGAAVSAADRRRRHVEWRAGLASARIVALDDLRTRVHRLGLDTRRVVDRAPRAELAGVPAGLAAELETLAAETVDALGAELGRLVAAALADLTGSGELEDLHLPDLRPPAGPPAPGAREGPPEDRLLVVAGASGGLGLSRLALLPLVAAPVVPAVLGVALLPVSVGLGVGAAAWLVHARRAAADRAHLRQWAVDALATARADLERVLAEALVVAEREVTLALDRATDRAPDRHVAPAAAGTAEIRAAVARAEAVLTRVRRVLDA